MSDMSDASMDAMMRTEYRRRTRTASSGGGHSPAPMHHTATVDRSWDAGMHMGRMTSPMTVATANSMFAWVDTAQADGGRVPKSACKLPHHEVSANGTPGAANLAGVRNALARLPQSDIPAADVAGVRAHLQAHLADSRGD